MVRAHPGPLEKPYHLFFLSVAVEEYELREQGERFLFSIPIIFR
jgi:hypothetical protein